MLNISCSIVLYHNPIEDVKKVIESFFGCAKNIKLYLIDNSKEDTFRYQFISPQIEYIFNGKNIGYGAGHNIAIQKAQGKSQYHLILNPDVEFDPCILDSLYNFMQSNHDVGLVMPKVYYKNGETQYLCKKLPSPQDLILRRFLPGPFKNVLKKYFEQYELRHKDYNSIMEVPNLSGCFMFVRMEVFEEVGLFDEQYFLYLEDTDLCRRINECYRTVYYPKVNIIHGYSKASYKSFRLMRYHLKSSILYFNKWGWFNDDYRNSINESVADNLFKPSYQLHQIIPALQYDGE
ncbi:MAG: glycosyltransferase family 2 protein [Sphingobacteriales bacterium]|nr:glycosyltransferase family 2 protein [Sphingobacteriales bacterium]